MEDRRCFVQFIHPGGEHIPDNGHKRWNEGAHRRKFLRSQGAYIEAGQQRDDELVFWAEWEPESSVVARYGDRMNDAPRFLYDPYYVRPSRLDKHQNTDPFVFGDQFLYTGCQQQRGKHPTQLRFLLPGSVVLFGSCLHGSHFVLDTVFVVGDQHIDHDALKHRVQLTNITSRTYRDVTVEPWYRANSGSTSWRLYFGATPEKPVDGMFSFFPCRPIGSHTAGFARPIVEIPDYITPTLRQGKKIKRVTAVTAMTELWKNVKDQVVQQGLALGVRADLPPRR